MSRDRLELLRAHPLLNGIDFVEVSADQRQLTVHFLNADPDDRLPGALVSATITGGEIIRDVPVLPLSAADWSTVADRPRLLLRVAAPGDFSNYTLTLVNDPATPAVLDRFFDHVVFSFKAGCLSTLDCETPPHVCPAPGDEPAPTIDYLAKDYDSFRAALLEFSAQRYPEWQERGAADFGVMFLEALSSLGDDLSYLQDRIAAEATLDSASERHSIVQHARLLDYEPRPATAARVVLCFDSKGGAIPAGLPVSAQAPDGSVVEFETGEGLDDTRSYPASPLWDDLKPYYWDDSERCLPRGAREVWIEGTSRGLFVGQQLLIKTQLEAASAPLCQIVTLSEAPFETVDPLESDIAVTRLRFRPEDALVRERDLDATTLHGNLVPATQGKRHTELFSIDGTGPQGSARAVLRTGPNASKQYLHTLRAAPLAWLGPAEPGDSTAKPQPELRLVERHTDGTSGARWAYRRSLLDAAPSEKAFTLDPMRFVTLGARVAGEATPSEYDGRDGDTIRFGDGRFGAIPDDETVFRIIYRTALGARGNVAAGSIRNIDPSSPLAALASEVENPFAAAGGADAETDEQVRVRAAQAFRVALQRAVRAEDYEEIAERLGWVQRAGSTFRHTGSWLTVFTSVDPIGGGELSLERHRELVESLDRQRLAGYDLYVPAPRFAALDLQVEVCAERTVFRGEVAAAVIEALSARALPDGRLGFFHPDRFTFGQSLERSALEAAIQGLPGVDGVRSIVYRRRGQTPGFLQLPKRLRVAVDEIVRVDSDPNRPERGSVLVSVQGGK